MTEMRRRIEKMWDPAQSLLPFGDGGWRWAAEQMAALDMYETDDQIVLKLSVPGVKPEDIKISFSDHTLTIHGETTKELEVKEEQFHRQERHRGVFTRTVALPAYASADKAEATCENGLLTITVLKDKQAQARAIPVKAIGADAPQKVG
jgi:HSP20 family protein